MAEDDLVATLDFGLAMTASDFDGAFQLLHDQYSWRAYMTPAPEDRRVRLSAEAVTTRMDTGLSPLSPVVTGLYTGGDP